MIRHRLVVGLCLCLAAIVLARPGVVKTKDGQTYDGDVNEKSPDFVTVTVRGIETRIDRNNIASLEYSEGFEKEFEARLAKLDPKDVNGRLALAREAFNSRKYTAARDVLEQARTIDPNNAEVAQLLETVQGQIRLERGRTTPPPAASAGATPPTPGTTPATTQSADHRFFKPAEINLIRQMEMRPGDNVRIRFERNLQKRFIAAENLQTSDFLAMSPSQQAQEILKKRPEMAPEIMVLNDPPALLQFRRTVQPLVLANCATAACHGGSGQTNLVLFSPADSDAVTYTNFYILQQYTKEVKPTGVFSGGNLRMIDRLSPTKSLLLQYSLPPAIAEYDHPAVPGYRAPLRGRDDPRYKQIMNWIGETLNPVDRDYGINYRIPSNTTRPATQPATQPAPVAPKS